MGARFIQISDMNGMQKVPCETCPDTVPSRAMQSPTNVDNSILIAEKESKIVLFFPTSKNGDDQ